MSNSEISIRFSEDELKAYADFIPGEETPFTIDGVRAACEDAGLTDGIRWDVIESAVLYCNEKKLERKNVKIASGIFPVEEIPTFWDLKKRFFETAMGFDPDALKVDFKDISPFAMVKKGELIGNQVKRSPGKEGVSVKGESIPFEKKNVVYFTPGRNTVEKDGNLYAARSGHFEVSGDRSININEVLEIKGNIDYHTGNISFDKDVIIEGLIKDGFKVAAGGNIYCKDIMDASNILCRKDLIMDKGIIGRKKGLVRAGGRIEARFIENCQVESKAGIFIEKDIMNSKVYTLGKLSMGNKGTIVSGEVLAEESVEVYNIGKEGSPDATVKVGFSYIKKRNIDSLKSRMDMLKKKVDKLRKIPDYRKNMQKEILEHQIEDSLIHGGEELKSRYATLYKYMHATVTVNGTVYPGTVIEICGVRYNVKDKKSRVRFFLNKEEMRVETTRA